MAININSLITLVIFILILTALAPTVISNLAYNQFNTTGTDNPEGQLVNASAGSKSMYSIVEILFPVVAIFGVLAVIGITKGKK